eukprot:694868-Amorphochlora_amoeboformis.AAC.1
MPAFLPLSPTLGAALFAGTVYVFGTLLSGYPSSRLGSVYPARELGYDKIRGEYSAPAAAIFLVTSLYTLVSLLEGLDVYIQAGIYASITLFGLWVKLGTPVSMPSGPRDHPMDRLPEWDGKTHRFHAGWRVEVDQESHEITEKEVEISVHLDNPKAACKWEAAVCKCYCHPLSGRKWP